MAGLCGQPYKQIAEQNPGVDEGYLKNNCFDAAWISALLTGFGFAPTSDAITWAASSASSTRAGRSARRSARSPAA